MSTGSAPSTLPVKPNPFTRILFYTLSFFLLSTLLFWLRFITPPGADGYFMANLIEGNPFPVYYRSMLTVLIHKFVYVVLHPLGFDGWDSIAASSSLAGGLALVAMYKLNPSPVFLAVNILCGAFMVFVGHVENYAWVNAFLLWTYYAFFRWFESGERLWLGTVFYLLACLSHMLALFYAPAILFALRNRRDFNPYEALVPLLAFLTVIISVSFGVNLLGTDIGLERLVPWFHTWAPNHFFTFLSFAHIKILLYFYWRASFLFMAVELPLLAWFLAKGRVNTRFLRFMLAHSVCGLAWTALWHPDWGYNDWDLFSQFAIPLHVLLGFLITDVLRSHSVDFFRRFVTIDEGG